MAILKIDVCREAELASSDTKFPTERGNPQKPEAVRSVAVRLRIELRQAEGLASAVVLLRDAPDREPCLFRPRGFSQKESPEWFFIRPECGSVLIIPAVT